MNLCPKVSAPAFSALFLMLAAALAAGSIAGAASGLPAPAPWFGTWRLNIEKSTSPGVPATIKRATCVIEPTEEGLRVTYDIVGTRGGVTHTEWDGRFDGRDYPVQGVDAVLTNAYTRVDDRAYDIATKVEGRIEASARVIVAPDGRTITTVTTRKGPQGEEFRTTTVYEKR